MPRFQIQSPDGRTVTVEGDEAPTQEDAEGIFASLQTQEKPKEIDPTNRLPDDPPYVEKRRAPGSGWWYGQGPDDDVPNWHYGENLFKNPEFQAAGVRMAGIMAGVGMGAARGRAIAGMPGGVVGGILGAIATEPLAQNITPRKEGVGETALNVLMGGVNPEIKAGGALAKLVGDRTASAAKTAGIGGLLSGLQAEGTSILDQKRLLTPEEMVAPMAGGAVVGGAIGAALPARSQPSLVTQIDSGVKNPTMDQANAKANDISMGMTKGELRDLSVQEPAGPMEFSEGTPLGKINRRQEAVVEAVAEPAPKKIDSSKHEIVMEQLDPESLGYLKEQVATRELTPEEYAVEVRRRATSLKKAINKADKAVQQEVKVETPPKTEIPVKALETPKESVSDLDRYNEIQAKVEEIVKSGKTIDAKTGEMSKELHDLWVENEAIKNRNAGMPPGQVSGKPLAITEKQLRDAAESQRGVPESTMSSVVDRSQKAGGPAVYNDLLEHVGDLSHRLQEPKFQGGAAASKLRKLNRLLNPEEGRMGIEEEIEYGLRNNAEYKLAKLRPDYETNPKAAYEYVSKNLTAEIDKEIAKVRETIKSLGEEYSKSHESHNKPVTYAGQLGKDAAIYLGRMDFKNLRRVSDELTEFYEKTKNSDEIYSAVKPVPTSKNPAKLNQSFPKGKAAQRGSILIPGEPTPPKEVAQGKVGELIAEGKGDEVALGSDQYEAWEPFLTGMKDSDNRLIRGLGHVAEVARMLGTVTDNIREISPPVAGVWRRYLRDTMDRTVDWTQRAMDGFRDSRKVMGKDFEKWSQLLLDRKVHQAYQLAATKKGGAEMMDAIDNGWGNVRDEILADHQRTRPGEEYEGLNQYYPRIISDLKGLMKAIDKSDPGPIKNALQEARDSKGSDLTQSEEAAVVNKLIYASSWLGRGKPGYLKERTIEELGDKLAKYFEPIDVSVETYINRSAKDITTREFFGKVDPNVKSPWLSANDKDAGSVGEVLGREVAEGRINPEGQEKIINSINAFFKDSKDASPSAWYFNRLIGSATTAFYLGDISTGVRQVTDAFLNAVAAGPKAATIGYGKAVQNAVSKIKGLQGLAPENFTTLQDLGIHEGSIETADFARGSTWLARTIGRTIKASIGIMDTIGKEGLANAVRLRSHEIAVNPESRGLTVGEANFDKMDERFSEMFPEAWPKMLSAIKSEDFGKKGKLTPESQFYLFNKVSDIQPVTRGELPEGMLSAGPWRKIPFRLTSYMTRQLGYMRRNVYDELKKGNVKEAASWFAAYSLFLAAGNSTIQLLIDKMQNKSSAPEEYIVGALLQIGGASRYSVSQAGKGDIAGMIGQRMFPAGSILKDAISDAALGRDWLLANGGRGRRYDSGEKVVRGPADFLKQSEMVKYTPFLGREIYGNLGKGALKERQRKKAAQEGRPVPGSLQTISEMVAPGPKKGSRP